MEKFQEAREKAKKNVRVADHILTQTYPLVNDPKLLIAVLENIFLSLTNSMGALLHYERLFKRIPPFHENFESKFNMLKMNVAHKHGISNDYLKFIQEVKSLLELHKKGPVEFSRKDVFVICSEKYDMKAVSVNDMKKYIAKTKMFIDEISKIVSKDEDLFKRDSEDPILM